MKWLETMTAKVQIPAEPKKITSDLFPYAQALDGKIT